MIPRASPNRITMIAYDVFKTATALPFRYKLKVGKNGEYNTADRPKREK